jgi:anti-anti-sigma factor
MTKITNKNNCLSLEGELSFATVPKVQRDILQIFSTTGNLLIDLNDSIAKDISAIALLICLSRFAKQHSKSISFINAKPNLLDLAKFSHLFELLPFTDVS